MQPQLIVQGVVPEASVDLVVYTVPLHTVINFSAVALVNISQETITANLMITSEQRTKKIRVAPANLELTPGNMYETTASFAVNQNEHVILNCSAANALSYHIAAQKFPAQPVPTDRGQTQ